MKIYVGTYKKYNNGNLGGAWLSLGDYTDADDFISACKKLHPDKDEDIELMFQDFDDIHQTFRCECDDMREVYKYVSACNEHTKAVIDAGLDCDIPLEWIMTAYLGRYESQAEFAYDMAKLHGHHEFLDDWPLSCIDWREAGRELMSDSVESENYYFTCHF